MAIILVQYLLGGMLRHLGKQLFEHIGLAAMVLLCGLIFFVMLLRTESSWLKSAGWVLLLLLGVQITLGLSAFVTKYGFAPTGYVAVHHSILQVIIRTSHTLVGMLLLMTSLTTLLRILHIESFRTLQPINITASLPQTAQLKGGAQ
ncbi:hypothetical protein MNBD_PLANCTO02-1700 [hydrothermal vent metagenome]|uniref:Uncharacterized protein n=1 Tax=hydrothermal vent metagenome TaxID=652676 RepID=A0A3B1E3B2_9ZZZZ